ncbi:MAG: type II toxin-antitoxin system RelE/ParE family toxin [bacterium]
MGYRLEITPTAIKERRKLPKSMIKRVDEVSKKLAQNPRPRGVKK